MTISIDRNLYSDACISKCIYSFSGEFECRRTLCGSTETIDIFSDQTIDEEELTRRFLQRLNDFKLREIVIEETKDIRTILYAKAFADCDDFNMEDEG